MALSKRDQQLNISPKGEKGFLSPGGILSSSGDIIRMLLNSIYLVLPWRGVPFAEERPRSGRLQRNQPLDRARVNPPTALRTSGRGIPSTRAQAEGALLKYQT
jgi:hypothetical protein